MNEKMKRIEEIEKRIEENGVYVKVGTEMNIMILEDVYEDIEDEIMWIINIAKERIEEV